jgi:hypothetical protein
MHDLKYDTGGVALLGSTTGYLAEKPPACGCSLEFRRVHRALFFVA